jgi:hypothetical protein
MQRESDAEFSKDLLGAIGQQADDVLQLLPHPRRHYGQLLV